MAVYIDPLTKAQKSQRWPFPNSCRMFADSDTELHNFAARLGIRHTWFQLPAAKAKGCKPFAHYDLNAGRREAAVQMGAVELSHHEMLHKLVDLNYLPESDRPAPAPAPAKAE